MSPAAPVANECRNPSDARAQSCFTLAGCYTPNILALLSVLVHIAPVTDSQDSHSPGLIFHGVDDTVITNPEPEVSAPFQSSGLSRMLTVGERTQAISNPLCYRNRQALQLTLG